MPLQQVRGKCSPKDQHDGGKCQTALHAGEDGKTFDTLEKTSIQILPGTGHDRND